MDLHHEEGTNMVPEGDLLLLPPLLWVGVSAGLPYWGA